MSRKSLLIGKILISVWNTFLLTIDLFFARKETISFVLIIAIILFITFFVTMIIKNKTQLFWIGSGFGCLLWTCADISLFAIKDEQIITFGSHNENVLLILLAASLVGFLISIPCSRWVQKKKRAMTPSGKAKMIARIALGNVVILFFVRAWPAHMTEYKKAVLGSAVFLLIFLLLHIVFFSLLLSKKKTNSDQ